MRILIEPKNALLKQYQKFFQFDDVDLVLHRRRARSRRRGGARSAAPVPAGLRAILEEVLLDVMYDLPSRSDVARCVIDRSVVLEHMTPTLVTEHAGPPLRLSRAAARGDRGSEPARRGRVL